MTSGQILLKIPIQKKSINDVLRRKDSTSIPKDSHTKEKY